MVEFLGLQLRLYGLMVGLGILTGGYICSWVAQREGLGEDIVWDGLWWVVGFGLIGARLYHVVDLWSYYSQNLGQIGAVWNGGLGIFGGVIGAVMGLAVFVVWVERSDSWLATLRTLKTTDYTEKMMMYLDIVSFGAPVAQAIGRVGNFFNQELYGYPSKLPWAVYIAPENRLAGFEEFSRFQPLFLYEGILNFGVFGVMVWVYKSGRWRVGAGKFAGAYLVGYGLVRFLLEPLRIERWEVANGVPTAWVFSGIMVMVGIALLAKGYKIQNTSNKQISRNK